MKNIFLLLLLLLINVRTGVSQSIQNDVPDNLNTSTNSFNALNNQEEGIASLYRVHDVVIVPNAFSPNGDGINDYFKIKGIEKYPEARLLVYTVSNKLVFEKSHYGNIDFWGNEADALWDGMNNIRGSGIILPNGTYIYILDLANGNQKLIKLGTVYIRR